MTKLLLLIGLIPLVAATAVAGIVSNPSKTRPCLQEFTAGVHGNPTHLILGPDGDLYAAEEPQRTILRFNPDTHATREYPVRITPHDLTAGPDGRIWFVSAPGNLGQRDTGFDKLGALDPKTGRVELYPGISQGAEPHMLRWDHGRLYITEQKAGRLAIFDPKTEKITEGTFGLPPGNYIHNIAVLPNGDFWAVLQQGDKLARFDFAKQQFDQFVDIPIPNSGPRDITYVPARNAIFATLFAANKLAEYDLDTGKLTLHDVGVDPITYQVAVSTKTTDRAHPKLTFVRPDASQKDVWIATLSGGELLRFNLQTDEVKRVGCGATIPGGPLGIATDGKGRLWVAITFPTGRIALVKQ
jgi:streptogramin lyase